MKRLLATLGLPPLPTVEALGEGESCQEELPQLLALDRFQVRLSDGPEEERVLWLRFASCGDEDAPRLGADEYLEGGQRSPGDGGAWLAGQRRRVEMPPAASGHAGAADVEGKPG